MESSCLFSGKWKASPAFLSVEPAMKTRKRPLKGKVGFWRGWEQTITTPKGAPVNVCPQGFRRTTLTQSKEP